MKNRNSCFEFAKVVGIYLIILNHVAYHSEINVYGANIDGIVAAFFTYMGQVGNGIFIFSTCYFVTEHFNVKRLINLILVTLFYSYCFLISFVICTPESLSLGGAIKSLFPIAFENNWFITAYFLFSLIVPYLFAMINSLTKKKHLLLVIGFMFFYCLVPSVMGSRYFITSMMSFLLIFFLVSYIKKYDVKENNKTTKSIAQLILLFILLFIVIYIVNLIGSKSAIFYGKTLFWLFPTSILILPICVLIFAILRSCKYWTNKIVNYTSSLSIGIYLIHENKLLVSSGIYARIHSIWAGRVPVAIEFPLSALAVFIIAFSIELIRKKVFGGLFDRTCENVYKLVIKLDSKIRLK